jgi:hypothetical protein
MFYKFPKEQKNHVVLKKGTPQYMTSFRHPDSSSGNLIFLILS